MRSDRLKVLAIIVGAFFTCAVALAQKMSPQPVRFASGILSLQGTDANINYRLTCKDIWSAHCRVGGSPSAARRRWTGLIFFPGFEDINNTESILQPVLGWYQGQWTVASWNCCLNGIATSSPAVDVSAADEIYGSITSTCPAGTLCCAAWNVLTLDMPTGESTTLSDTPSEGQIGRAHV